jgi:hypothetical protein
MGHMLKNTVFRSGSHALGVPIGSSSIGPDPATVGQVRWNTTTNSMEYTPDGLNWNAFAHEGTANIIVSSFTGNSSITTYSPFQGGLTYTSGQEKELLVFNGTVPQIPNTNYTVSGNAITFLGAVSDGATIIIFHNFASTTAA